MTYYRAKINEWLGKMDIDCDSVLDIGGARRTVQDRVNSCKCNRYVILDREYYKGQRFDPQPDIVHDMNYPLETKEKFDKVFMVMMFEYLWNPFTAMQNVRKLCKGEFYFNAMLRNPDRMQPDFMWDDSIRVTDRGIKIMLKEAGFKLQDIKFYEKNNWEFYLVKAI